MLILDNREPALHELIKVEHQFVQLHIGDIIIGESVEKPTLILERKTYADFQASIIDGRYREQRGRLLASGVRFQSEQSSDFNGASPNQGFGRVRVGYVLEGSPTMLRPPMTAMSIEKIVARLMLVHGVAVFRAPTTAGTAALVETLHSMWIEEPKCFDTETNSQRAADGIHVVKKNNTESPEIFGISLLCLVPGISVKAAEAWLTAFGTVGAVIKADEKTLADVKNGTRRIGNAVAARAIKIWESAGLRETN
jgi:ERCC4-type nuclease